MKLPDLKRHASGRAYVRHNGKCIYFGPFGSDEANHRFDQWLEKLQFTADGANRVTLLLLSVKFVAHAKLHYRKDGLETGEVANIQQGLRTACKMFGRSLVVEFGPKKLKAIRDQMISDGLCRNTINARIRRLRHVFKWGVSEQLVPPSVLVGLQAVQGLNYGRSAARESMPVGPVSELNIMAIEPHCTRQIWGLVRFMLLTGCRPGEAVMLRWCDIDAEQSVWVYRPSRHKTQHRGKKRLIAIGPEAQKVLNQFPGADTDFVFQPQQALHEFVRQNYGKTETRRQVGPHYTTYTLRAAIRVACRKAGIDSWHPNQLRHNAATTMRHRAGVDVAQVALGHASVRTTECYAEQNIDAAILYAARHG